MKAKKISEANGINRNHRKEDHFSREYIFIAKIGDKLKDVIRCKFYATKVRLYCCLWIRTETDYVSGSGYAGGYGYHKPSAALSAAIEAAGYELSEDIDGRGDSAMEEALQALACLYGYKGQMFYAHG